MGVASVPVLRLTMQQAQLTMSDPLSMSFSILRMIAYDVTLFVTITCADAELALRVLVDDASVRVFEVAVPRAENGTCDTTS